MRGKDSRAPGYIPNVRWLPGLFLLAATSVAAQGSPFIPLDHPLLPLAEYLIARGDLVDPSPMVRPFRRADLIGAIDRAALDSATPSGRIAATLRAAFTDRAEANWARFAPRIGAEVSSRARRDLLHPAGDGAVRFYADAAFEGRFGNIVLASRPAAENRLKTDPDWGGGTIQQRKNQAYRFAEGYLAAQFEHVRLFFGQMSRNWGPVGTLGLSIADYGYPRTDLGFGLVFRDFQIDFVGTQLTGMVADDGAVRSRYFLAHRLNVRATHRLNLAIWETGLLSPDRTSFDPTFFNALVLLSFPAQLGLPDERNTIIGGDLSWRVGRVLLEGQAMIDDRWRLKADPSGTGEPSHPGRWALTGAAGGPLSTRATWRTTLAVVSSLAYRTIDSTKNFVDRGIGIGPNFTDRLVAGASVSVPVAGRWLVTPDLTYQVQGEGRIDIPFPADAELTNTPEIFIGRTEKTLRLGLTVSGGAGRFEISGTGGYFRTTDLDHVAGATRNRFEARLRATVGFAKQGVIR